MADVPQNSSASLIAVGLQITQAINNLNQTVATVFPLADAAITGSAGAATGDYLTIEVNGTPYKLLLLAPS